MGQHRVVIAYGGFRGEESVDLAGEVKRFDLTVKVKPVAATLSPMAYAIFVLLMVVLSAVLGMLIHEKRAKSAWHIDLGRPREAK